MNALVVEEKIQEWKQKGDPTARLDLSHLGLTRFPLRLPAELTHLVISGNHFTHVPILPRGLQIFTAEFGQIETIEGPFPSTLHTLHVSNNRIHTLPLRLPQALHTFYASCNQLTELPEVWIPPPTSSQKGNLHTLHASNNNLHTFPLLPHSTYAVDLHSNRITSPLPPLPVSLTKLNLHNNRLTAFPSFLPPNLQTLSVSSNQITYLPEHFVHTHPSPLYRLHRLQLNHNPLLDKQAGEWEFDLAGDYFVATETEHDYYVRIVDLQHKQRAQQAPAIAKARTALFKEELVMHVWRPERVAALLEAGYDPEDL